MQDTNALPMFAVPDAALAVNNARVSTDVNE
jgi:hypothetical protein